MRAPASFSISSPTGVPKSPYEELLVDEPTNPIQVSLLPLSLERQPSSLMMVTGPGAPQTYELYRDEVVVGRAIDVDIPVNATDLSRKHATLKRDGNSQWTITDLGSRNGLYLNGVKIHAALLHDGDNIQLGTVVFVFQEGRGAQQVGG